MTLRERIQLTLRKMQARKEENEFLLGPDHLADWLNNRIEIYALVITELDAALNEDEQEGGA